MAQRVIINWGISAFYGFGVYGLNLALQWSRDPEMIPVCPLPLSRDALPLGPDRLGALETFIRDSHELHAQLEGHKGEVVRVRLPLLASLGGDFNQLSRQRDVVLFGDPNIGVVFFHDADFTTDALDRARLLPVIVAGSTWNKQVLEARGLPDVRLVLQGVDPELFHPGPRPGRFGERFVVFSGGKLERRKGQDIVLAAFRQFAGRHPDALLVTAWHSPWPDVAAELDASGLAAPVPLTGARVDVPRWAADSGIAPDQVLDLGPVPNTEMPAILRDVDVALFPNRAEGGTNLVAMECMACGAPTVLSGNTGHLDLIADGNCYALERQAPVSGAEGWGESDVDEVVEMLERAYADPVEARRRGREGAASVGRLTWANTAGAMKSIVQEFTHRRR